MLRMPEHWPRTLNRPECGHVTMEADHVSCKLNNWPIRRDDHANHACLLKANKPVPSDVLAYYFETKIVGCGDRGDITIGFVPRAHKQHTQPGYGQAPECTRHRSAETCCDFGEPSFCRLEPASYGLNGHEGQIFKASAQGENFSYSFFGGDVIGAGIIPAKGHIFFTCAYSLAGPLACILQQGTGALQP
jgi:hypothetical protein